MTPSTRFQKEDRRIRRNAILAGCLCLIIGFASGISAKMLWDYYAKTEKGVKAEAVIQEYRADLDLDAKRRAEKMKIRTRVKREGYHGVRTFHNGTP